MTHPDSPTTTIENWADLPLHTVLYEWLVKNMYIPTDMGTLVAYIGLFLITWYTIIWIVRVLMSVIWPLFIISSAIVVFRILQYYEPEEITGIMNKSFTIVADTMVAVLAKALELMPVAVRLVEVLSLVTLLGILTGFSILVVVLQRVIFLSLFILSPITQFVANILYASERVLVGTLMQILHLTNGLGDSVQN